MWPARLLCELCSGIFYRISWQMIGLFCKKRPIIRSSEQTCMCTSCGRHDCCVSSAVTFFYSTRSSEQTFSKKALNTQACPVLRGQRDSFNFSKVCFTVTLYSKYSGELDFENSLICRRALIVWASATGKISQKSQICIANVVARWLLHNFEHTCG